MLESKPHADRWFFGLAGLWFVALTLVGFSPTFYWRSNPVPLPFHLIIHGVLYSTWIVVFLCQTQLIATGRTAWHRRLGAVSVLLLILMIPVGFYVVLELPISGLVCKVGEERISSDNRRRQPSRMSCFEASQCGLSGAEAERVASGGER